MQMLQFHALNPEGKEVILFIEVNSTISLLRLNIISNSKEQVQVLF